MLNINQSVYFLMKQLNDRIPADATSKGRCDYLLDEKPGKTRILLIVIIHLHLNFQCLMSRGLADSHFALYLKRFLNNNN